MSEATRDLLEAIEKILLRCWVAAVVLGLFSFIVFLLTGDMIDRIHGSLFGLTPHELDLVIYCGLGLLKLFVLVFYVFPWLAIKLVLRADEGIKRTASGD